MRSLRYYEASVLLACEEPYFLQADKAEAGDCQDLRFSWWAGCESSYDDVLKVEGSACLLLDLRIILGLKEAYEDH